MQIDIFCVCGQELDIKETKEFRPYYTDIYVTRCENCVADGRQEGFDKGYEEGSDKGYANGFDEGQRKGYDEGYKQGAQIDT